jgi:hypothetical protein
VEEENFLTDDFLRQLINVGEVDVLVGLPTHNNAKNVGSIVHTIRNGILRGFPVSGRSSSMPTGDRAMALPN